MSRSQPGVHKQRAAVDVGSCSTREGAEEAEEEDGVQRGSRDVVEACRAGLDV